MIVGPLLKLRDKLTNKRKSLIEDTEKPFLEHLDDLRKTIMRIVITLMIAVTVCFVFNEKFFELMREPLRNAGLDRPKEYKLPASVIELSSDDDEQQSAWWHIHGTARGMADLDGPLRDSFTATSAPDDFTRRFAWAMLLYHASDSLPVDKRAAWIAEAAKNLPEGDRSKVIDFAAELAAAKTSTSLEKPRDALEMETFAPPEGFMLSMKLSLFAGIIISFPFLFYFLLEFILPGLTGKERKMIFPALAIGFGLFLAGVAFAWWVVVPQTLKYFSDYNQTLGVLNNWRVGYYQSFVTSFTLLFGAVFETPVVIMVMVKLGLLTSRVMRSSRGWAIIIMLVAAAVITPTGDMFSMSLMAGPMIVMYEICVWLAWFHERKQAKIEAEEQRRDQARRAALIGVAGVQAGRPEDADASESTEHDSGHAALPYDSDHYHHHDSSPSSHPHHPDESTDGVGDYEQYLRDHAGLYSTEETHPESTPVEDRQEPASENSASSEPESAPAVETNTDIPAADSGEPKREDGPA